MAGMTWIKVNKAKTVLAVLALAATAVVVMALALHITPLSWGLHQPINSSGGLAIKGYDPVSYHTSGVATQGSGAITLSWNGADWHFSSQENLALFEGDPERYAPAFGSNCAQAVSSKITATANPEVWHMEGDNLYLFLNQAAKEKFVSRIGDGVIEQTERNWAGQ